MASDGERSGTFPSLTEGESVPSWNSTPVDLAHPRRSAQWSTSDVPYAPQAGRVLVEPVRPDAVGLPGVGIDRLSFSFPVSSYADRADATTVDADGNVTGCSWRVENPVTVDGQVVRLGVFVGVRNVAGRAWAKVEANPSRFVDPRGCSLLDPNVLDGAAMLMFLAAREVVEPSRALSDCRVTRVDVARDFRGVTSPALYVDGLRPIRRAYGTKAFHYNDPQKGHAQTLYVGTKTAGGVRLYDQHAAYADKGAPEGSLRWEVEARKGWLESVGVTHLRELDPVAVDRLASDRWEWSKMGQSVSGPVNAVELLQQEVRAKRVTQAVADRLLGEMVRRSFGFGEGSRTTAWRYKDVTDRLGMTAEALWSNDLTRQLSGRLDFETGTELLALTA